MTSMATNKVRVMYSYTYKTKEGKEIRIIEGEKFLLNKKANAEWWSVTRDDGHRFYVPANYVKEITGGSPKPTKKAENNDSGKSSPRTNGEDSASYENTEAVKHIKKKAPPPPVPSKPTVAPRNKTSQQPESPGDTLQTPEFPTITNGNTETLEESDLIVGLIDEAVAGVDDSDLDDDEVSDHQIGAETLEGAVGGVASSSQYEEPSYANLSEIQQHIHRKPESPLLKRVSESGLADYANLQDIRPKTAPSSPAPRPKHGEKPVNKLTPEWVVYVDEAHDRNYYYNTETKQSSWAAPRIHMKKDSGNTPISSTDSLDSVQEDSAFNTADDSSASADDKLVVPSGWVEKSEENTGASYFIHVTTGQKWFRSTDEEGRTYFYKEDSSESAWELPQTLSGEDVEDDDGETGNGAVEAPLRRLTKLRSSDRTVATRPNLKIEKRELLNRTKVSDNGKRVKKNWQTSFIVFKDMTLYFYKDQKSSTPTPKSSVGKPEEVIDLHGAEVSLNPSEKTKKRNALLVRLMNNTEYLLQGDDPVKIHDWYLGMSYHLKRKPHSHRFDSTASFDEDTDKPADVSLEEESPSSPASSIPRKSSKKAKKGSLEKSGSRDDLSGLSPTEQKTKIKGRLINFLRKRPAMESLEKKGIIKTIIFGSTIEKLCSKDKLVPVFVQQCIEAIEVKGLDSDGLYRISGNQADIQRFRFAVERDENFKIVPSDWDINVLTGALKLFFRELKEPLFPPSYYDRFVSAIGIKHKFSKLKEFKDLVKQLPRCNRETMKVMFRHLNRVIEQSQQNRMQVQNVAIVFGPTLMWTLQSDPSNVAINMVLQNQIVEFCLIDHEKLFK